jgi:TRAP-type C4-dicarboxylate transport system permease small subunit
MATIRVMDDRSTKRGGWAAVVMVLVVVLMVLPLLYVLSFGWVIWMAQSNRIDPTLKRALVVTYRPLVWTAENDVPILGPAIM